MASIIKAFTAEDGFGFVDDKAGLFFAETEPNTGGGEAAPESSILLVRPVSGTPSLWIKSGAADTDWSRFETEEGDGPWIDTVNPLRTNDDVDTAGIGRTFAVSHYWVNTANKSLWICMNAATNAAVWLIVTPGTVTHEPTGFPNRTDSVYSFTNASRTFSIQPAATSFDTYKAGEKTTYTSAQSVAISDIEGQWYFYFDKDTNVLTATQTFSYDIILRHVYVATVYWNATDKKYEYMGDERHGFMPGVTHLAIHNSLGTQYLNGLDLNSFLVDQDGSLDTHAQFSSDAGAILDEGNILSIPEYTHPGNYAIYYKAGTEAAPVWRSDAPTDFACKRFGPTNRLAYNSLTAGTYGQTETSNGGYVISFLAATNDLERPMVVIQGRREYASQSLASLFARSEAYDIIRDESSPFTEIRMVGAVIFNTADSFTNTVKARIVSTVDGEDYEDLRDAELIAGEVLSLRSFATQAISSSKGRPHGGKIGVKVTSNGTALLNVNFPVEAVEITDVYAIVAAKATVTGVDIDLASTYCNVNEPLTQHTEVDNLSTFDFIADYQTEMRLSTVFSQASGGDLGGVTVDHNNIGTTVYYYNIRVDYLAY